MKIWFDITNTPQVHFLLAIQKGLQIRGFSDFIISARDFSETVKLLNQRTDKSFIAVGSYHGKNLSNKALGLIRRFIKANTAIRDYDLSISCGSESAIWSAFMRRKRSIAFGDNDLAKQWTYSLFVDYTLFPKSIPARILQKQGLNSKKLYQYDGLKEHVYIADFFPDPEFKSNLPFENYVVVRPENINANYLNGTDTVSIVPCLLKLLSSKGINIVFLPRYDSDRFYAEGIGNVFIPGRPLNGLDACYYSDGVFTGAGTLAREAACLGIPSFSFFMGKKLLAVDNALVEEKKMFYSRDPGLLVENFIHSGKTLPNFDKAKAVNKEVITKLTEIILKLS